MAQHVVFFWGAFRKVVTCDLAWDQITHSSVVIVTASEGAPPISSAAPERFVGDARFTVNNVAPRDGGVTFRITIEWDDPLNLWTTVTVFDEPAIFGSVPFPPPH
jgi:hypothetical protein